MKKEVGWHYTQDPIIRRKLIYDSTDKQRSKYIRYLQAAKKMEAVFNANLNSNVKQTAKADSDYFYSKVRSMSKQKVTEKPSDKKLKKWSNDYMKAWGGK